MAIIPQQGLPIVRQQAVTLEEYARYIEYSECSFFGVRANDFQDLQCRDFWSFQQRQNILQYLVEAQEEIEDEVGFFLSPKWVVGQLSDQENSLERYVDEQFYTRYGVYRTRWQKIIAIGIKAEDQAKLFEAFEQVGASDRRLTEGTGLGLHLSQKLAQLLGGYIEFSSDFGSGSTFKLVFGEGKCRHAPSSTNLTVASSEHDGRQLSYH